MKELLTKKEAHELLGVKECSKCGGIKPLDQFHKRTRVKCGYRAECKECKKIADAERYNKNKKPLHKEPTPIAYPKSLVMVSMDSESWTMLDYLTAAITISCAVVGIYFYIKGF